MTLRWRTAVALIAIELAGSGAAFAQAPFVYPARGQSPSRPACVIDGVDEVRKIGYDIFEGFVGHQVHRFDLQCFHEEREAKGAVLTDQANLLTANINLRYTDIVSPIGGRISSTNVTKGNVVGPDSGSLTMIVSQDPMYVTFPVSQRDFLRAREKGGQVDTKSIKVRVLFADGSAYDQLGEINFIDVTVNRATDTVLVRAIVPNPSGGIIDGQLVRVVLASATPIEKVVVPQAALIADQEGVYVFVVEDGKAAVKRVKPGGAVGTNVAIEEGLSEGEQVIVEGLQSVRPGTPVRATPLPPTLGQS